MRKEAWLRIALCVLMLTSLYLLSVATENSAVFGRLHTPLLVINVVALAVLVGLIAMNLWRLIRQRRQGETGSRLTVRLVLMFVILAVVPVSVVYYFSMQFLERGIETWFGARVEQQAMEDALRLSQASLDMRMRELLSRVQRSAGELATIPDGMVSLQLGDLRERMQAAELTVLGNNGRIIAASTRDTAAILPHRPEEDVLLQVRQGRPYVGLDPVGNSGLNIRVLVPSTGPEMPSGDRIVQALFPISPRLNDLAEKVQAAYAQYKEVTYLTEPLKSTFSLTLSLVLLLSLLFAVWSAFYAARRLVAPIRDLAEGTAAVAAGEYGKQLPPAGRDEMGFLVRSFNDMSRRVARARDQARTSQIQVENQRAYLEAVLSRLSSGVLALDQDGSLRTFNQAAEDILDLSMREGIGKTLTMLAARHPHVAGFAEALDARLRGAAPEWRDQLTIPGANGSQVLMCSGATLAGRSGFVIVFDDVTALIQAQRDAAWGEVARRLAHEIKNPLTPIQLSAERLRHKYLKTMKGKDAEVLERATHTIVQQVDAMKKMVNAFTEYAHPARTEFESVDLNALVSEVMDLYRASPHRPDLVLDLAPDLPRVAADAGRMRQLLHNLIKNALEACAEQSPCRLELSTRALASERFNGVELRVRDYGPGFAEDVMGRLFEPYVTTKPRGTGLGMPIVKKIVEEHNGMITAENLADGAQVTVCLPLGEGPAESAGASTREDYV